MIGGPSNRPRDPVPESPDCGRGQIEVLLWNPTLPSG
jgi:hypothetical protein